MEMTCTTSAQAGQEDTNKSPEQIFQMSSPLLMSPLWPHMEFPDKLTEEEKTWFWFIDSSASYTGTAHKGAAAGPHPYSLGQWWRKIFPVAGLWAVKVIVYLARKENWPQVWIYIDSWAAANGLAEK